MTTTTRTIRERSTLPLESTLPPHQSIHEYRINRGRHVSTFRKLVGFGPLR